MHRGVAQQQAANIQTHQPELPAARAFEGRGAAAVGGGAGGGGGWANRLSNGASQFMRPMKRGLGIAALGTAGALAYGLHRQNVHDREQERNIYAPMTGVY